MDTGTTGDQQRVQLGDLLLEFESDGALSQKSLDLIIGVNLKRA